ncbi:MAG: hypothetical protein KTR25_09610 [Myxococcales bacterium]|nr:hypothetical protein [Myxococcales bacterium]
MTSEVVSLTSYSAPERRSRKEGENLVRRWRASGLSQAAFSRQEGIR